ncbi:MAG: hypothetical protein ACPL4H_10435 [Anaerolineales bacterium]
MNEISSDPLSIVTQSVSEDKTPLRITRLYWILRRAWRRSKKDRSFRNLSKALPQWRSHIEQVRSQDLFLKSPYQRIVLFGVLQYWIEQTTLLASTLAGLGKEVIIATMPYSSPNKYLETRNLLQQDQKINQILGILEPYVKMQSLYPISEGKTELLPEELEKAVQQISLRDVQYLLQVEDFDIANLQSQAGRLYALRYERNHRTAQAAYVWLRQQKPQVVIIPNGSVLETAIIYRIARYLDIPTITYEFGEQRQKIWLSQNGEVMLQETDALWEARKNQPLTESQKEALQALFSARQKGDLWQNFARRWQGIPSQGSQQARLTLHLDERPVILLAANVIGDSLTLGRQIFTKSMTEWLVETVKFIKENPTVQLVVRVHPGERYTKGPSVAVQLQHYLGNLPEHIHIVRADDPINTYDLIGLADFGLVYTTTAGLEMAMAGVPVVVAGKTHYRGRGFTIDPQNWNEYLATLKDMLGKDKVEPLSREKIELAWNYAYRFFFEYPLDFPWRLHFFKQGDIQEWPLSRVLSQEGWRQFGSALSVLCGAPLNWSDADGMKLSSPFGGKEL